MNPYDFIHKKKSGNANSPESIKKFVAAYMNDTLAAYQMSAWLMAVCFNGLSDDELFAYTEALIESGSRFDLSAIEGVKVDKHSTGGVGDKVSLVLAPLVAACGTPVPMISGRGLGHTGGTLDKLAAIPGFRTNLTANEFKQFLEKTGLAMMGQSSDLCPADGKIYALRDVTATVESIPLIAASISAKKIAEGTNGLVLDTKLGNGAFMTNQKQAEKLARTIISITKKFNLKTTAVLSNMNQPLGEKIGNSLEIQEAIDCLKGQGPNDLRKLVLKLAKEMLLLAGWENQDKAYAKAKETLDSGNALDKFRQMIQTQGGEAAVVENLSLLPQASYKIPVKLSGGIPKGFLNGIDTYRIGMLAVELGAGRKTTDDVIDTAVGFEIFKKIGDTLRQGETLAIVHANNKSKGLVIAEELLQCFSIGTEDREPLPLIIKTIY